MEQKQRAQFTFFDLYWELIKQLENAAAGRFASNICAFMFTDEEILASENDKQNFFWSNIIDVLEEDKRIKQQGKNRTAQKLKQTLNAVFDVIAEDYDLKSPMAKIVLSHYEVKKGKAYTLAEEKTILDYCKENPHYYGNSALIVLLYTGMRVGELKTMRWDATYIYCESKKVRKGYAAVIRKIPICRCLER